MSTGIANPMPAFDPEGEMMAVLTPTTLPLESSSGPPEFPGLTAASVWIGLQSDARISSAGAVEAR
jgi:hypothetical protein